MSVLEKSSRIVERAIDAGKWGEVGVRAERDGYIIVRWLCGDAREFTVEDLEGVMTDIELLRQYPDVWFATTDSHGRRFAARVVDGVLYADSAPRPGEGGSCVSWKALRKALRKAKGE